MKIEQLYTGCLAQGAYYIESNGQAAIIDPLREVQAYIDLANERDLQNARDSLPDGWPVLEVSAKTGFGIEDMKDFIYDNLHFMSIYLKPQGQEADMVEPLIVKDTSTVRDVCVKLHRDFVRKFRYARVKGPSAKFDWQRVGLEHILKDGDVLSIIIRK